MREISDDIVQVKTEELQHIKTLIEKIMYRENQVKSESDLMDIKEVTNYTKYSKSSIYKFVKSESIPFIRKKGKLLFSKKKIDEWIAGS